MDTSKEKWNKLTNLCWEGFDKVRKYASKNYPNESVNKSLELFINEFEGDWDKKINSITR